jgi:hypothetical protein
MAALPSLVLAPQEISSNETATAKTIAKVIANTQPTMHAPLWWFSLVACVLAAFVQSASARQQSDDVAARQETRSQETRQVERRWPFLNSEGAIFFSSSDPLCGTKQGKGSFLLSKQRVRPRSGGSSNFNPK